MSERLADALPRSHAEGHVALGPALSRPLLYTPWQELGACHLPALLHFAQIYDLEFGYVLEVSDDSWSLLEAIESLFSRPAHISKLALHAALTLLSGPPHLFTAGY